MKRCAILLFAAIIIVVTGCKKSDTRNRLNGEWELRAAQSGMTPVVNYQPGNGNTYQFSDSTYQQFNNGVLIKSGKYAIIPDASVTLTTGIQQAPGQFSSRIIFDSDTTSEKIFIQFSDSQLNFISGYFPTDGGSASAYERIR